MTRKLWALFSVASLLTFVQCTGRRESANEQAERTSVAVELGQVELSIQGTGFQATGSVQSRTITPISAKVMGYVTAVHVREGQQVTKNALLVEIDQREARARFAQAEAAADEARQMLEEVENSIRAAEAAREAAAANAELAGSTFDRFRELLDRKSVSQQEYDEVAARNQAAGAQLRQATEVLEAARAKKGQVLSRIRQAEAMLDEARLHLGYCNVTAPFSGVVSDKQVETGQLASPGSTLLTLEDPGNFEVEAVVSESRIQSVSVGLTVEVRIDALRQTSQGTVREIVPRADPLSRSITVKIRIDSLPGLRSGLFASALFPEAGEETLTVPESAVVRRGQLVGIYLVDENNRARFRLVKTGRVLGDRIEILAGAGAGDRVVLTPSAQLEDGSPVTLSADLNRSCEPEIGGLRLAEVTSAAGFVRG